MNFPQYISTTERTVSVIGNIKTDTKKDENKTKDSKNEYVDGKGYIDNNGFIWIYSINGKPKNKNEYPYFWFNKNKDMVFSNPDEDTKKKYN